MSTFTPEQKSRFSAKTVPEPNTGCLLWEGYANEDGYGTFRVGPTMTKAHRFAWVVENGPIPEGIKVLHKCDTPACCNPSHLFLGSQADNVKDMRAKGRDVQLRGLSHGRAKLSDEDINSIRLDPRGSRVLAREFGVSQSHVRNIKTGARR